jgi:signal transduction histidine kinase
MVLKVSLLIAIIFQIIAAIVSLRLTKRTKYNLSWIFITLGFLFLLVRVIIETLPFYSNFKPQDFRILYIWFGVASSIFFAVGLILIGKIFSYMERMEKEKRASEQRFLSIIIKAEENERRRLAKDLHDGLGPLLSTIKMSISALKKEENSEHSKEILSNLDNVIHESIKSIKDISNNLSPHVLDHFGLNKAIQNFIDKINTTETLKINFRSNLNEQRFDQNVESVLYRVACELINNTMKYANATKVDIDLKYDIYSIDMKYADDGIGFEVDNLFKPQEKSTGYYNMYSRISTLKGKIEVNSLPDKGVDILISIPFVYE